MKLVYSMKDKPSFGKNLVFAIQQFLAIIATAILAPVLAQSNAKELFGITEIYVSQSAALVGAGVGTLVYLAFTKMKSPVFLGSSFAFIMPLATALTYGYCGIILGSVFAGLVYVVIALLIKAFGSKWINKLMPPVIIGPVVALIGLDLSGSAINNVCNTAGSADDYNLVWVVVGLVTFFATVIVSVKGKKIFKLIPFIVGVLAGYVTAVLFTVFGYIIGGNEYFNMVSFEAFKNVGDFSNWIPNITFIGAIKEIANGDVLVDGAGILSLFVAFAPVALVTFAEHIADHKNISSIVEKDLLEDPGLDKTLLGDGIGSIAGAAFGGCPNTTYGESIGCVALTGNASCYTILTTAILSIVIAFFYPLMCFVETIPACVVGGICIALYGFIAVSGLRMFKNVDLDDPKNIYIVAGILVTGVGGFALNFGKVTVSNIATALLLGIALNLIFKPKKNDD